MLPPFDGRSFNFNSGSPRLGRNPREVDPDLWKMKNMSEVEKREFLLKRNQEKRYNRHRTLMKQYDTKGYEETWVNV